MEPLVEAEEFGFEAETNFPLLSASCLISKQGAHLPELASLCSSYRLSSKTEGGPGNLRRRRRRWQVEADFREPWSEHRSQS